jgi:hypothetical protein
LRYATPFWLCYQKDALAKQSIRTVIQFFRHIFNRKTMPWFADHFISPDDFPATTPGEVMATFRSSAAPTALPAE